MEPHEPAFSNYEKRSVLFLKRKIKTEKRGLKSKHFYSRKRFHGLQRKRSPDSSVRDFVVTVKHDRRAAALQGDVEWVRAAVNTCR